VLAYITEKAADIIVTITAYSPAATPKPIQVTLKAHDTISIVSTASSIDYQGTATIRATCATGAIPTLSAAGTGKDKN
jgi:hypothetical protein